MSFPLPHGLLGWSGSGLYRKGKADRSDQLGQKFQGVDLLKDFETEGKGSGLPMQFYLTSSCFSFPIFKSRNENIFLVGTMKSLRMCVCGPGTWYVDIISFFSTSILHLVT